MNEDIMKLVILIGLCLALSSENLFSQAPTLVAGWPYRTITDGGLAYNTPVFDCRIDPDNAVFFCNATHDINKFYWDSSLYPGWPYLADSIWFTAHSPTVVDIDKNGRSDVVTAGFHNRFNFDNDLLFIVDEIGQILPNYPIYFQNEPVSLNLFDIDDDNQYEILRYTVGDQLVHCLNTNGEYEPGWPVPLGSDVTGFTYCGSGGAVGDLDLDGTNEYIVMGFHHIYAYKYDGTMMPGFPIVVPDSGNFEFTNGWAWPPTLADMDHDGYLEIIVSGDNWDYTFPPLTSFIAIFNHDGSIKEGWPIYSYNEEIVMCPIPADINNDGEIEIGYQGRELNFIDINGNNLPGWPSPVIDPIGRNVGTYSDLIVVDVNGDRDCEIFIDCGSIYVDSIGEDSTEYWGHGFIYGFDHLGNYLPGFPLRVRGETFSRPPNFYFDQDTFRAYMALYSTIYIPEPPIIDTSFVELYVFPDSTGPADQWPMLSHDNLFSRNYNFVDRVTSVDDGDREILPKSAILSQNYPNPFNRSTTIEFTLPRKEHATLSVFDILGRKVIDIYDQEMEAGYHRNMVTMDVPSGIYLYRLQAGNTVITRKMTLLK
jgi:hypothetical protein